MTDEPVSARRPAAILAEWRARERELAAARGRRDPELLLRIEALRLEYAAAVASETRARRPSPRP
jgi:hypothetical protein